jgi:hypothetical protein
MTVADVIERLQQFPLDQQVQITDGFDSKCYKGDFAFQLFEDVDESTFVDIGIGGCQYA